MGYVIKITSGDVRRTNCTFSPNLKFKGRPFTHICKLNNCHDSCLCCVLVSGLWFLVFDLCLCIMSCVSCFVFPCPHVSFKFPCVFPLLNFHALLCLLSFKFLLCSPLWLPLSVVLFPSCFLCAPPLVTPPGLLPPLSPHLFLVLSLVSVCFLHSLSGHCLGLSLYVHAPVRPCPLFGMFWF